jgi:NAD(P)-dependent dehydrogenase (short-subunit alcohol dehydrogenase family)
MDLHGRAVLLTGVKRIGAIVARALAGRGAVLAVSYHRSADEARQLARDITALGGRAVPLQTDLSRPGACGALVDEAANRLGRLDALVNMASVYERHEFGRLTEYEWEYNLAVDLEATWACTRAAVPHLRRAGEGRVVNFSDWVARSGRPRYFGYLTYYVAKAGVIALTEALALELAADRILVNCIAPGPIMPPPGTTAEEVRAVEEATPLRRWGGGDEIARAVVSLIETDFITGETIRVDGGRHVR